MRNKRIEMEYSGYGVTVLYDINTKTLWHYEDDREAMHDDFGGKQYYVSCTGLSGAGYLEPVGENAFFECRAYRTDAYDVPNWEEIVEKFTRKNVPPQIFIPIKAHKGINFDFPAVISDGGKVLFVKLFNGNDDYEITEAMKNFHECKYEEKEITWWGGSTNYPTEQKFTFLFANPDKCRGVNAENFVNLPQEMFAWEEHREQDGSLLEKALNLTSLSYCEEANYHISRRGYLDAKINIPENENCQVTHVYGNWYTNCQGFFWQRKGNEIQFFLERKRAENCTFDACSKFVSIIDGTDLFDWYEQSIEEKFQLLELAVRNIELDDYLQYMQDRERRKKNKEKDKEKIAKFQKLFSENPETNISLFGALKAGNCRDGVLEFLRKYGLPEAIRAKSLLLHKKFAELCLEEGFCKTIEHIFSN